MFNIDHFYHFDCHIVFFEGNSFFISAQYFSIFFVKLAFPNNFFSMTCFLINFEPAVDEGMDMDADNWGKALGKEHIADNSKDLALVADCRHDAFDPHCKEDREEAEDKNVEESENFLDMAVGDEDAVALAHVSVSV